MLSIYIYIRFINIYNLNVIIINPFFLYIKYRNSNKIKKLRKLGEKTFNSSHSSIIIPDGLSFEYISEFLLCLIVTTLTLSATVYWPIYF